MATKAARGPVPIPALSNVAKEIGRRALHVLKPSRWVKDVLKIEPDPWQVTLLNAGPGEDAIVAGRQSGKSAAASWLAAHYLAHNQDATAIAVSPSLRQSGEIVRRVAATLDTAETKLITRNAFSLETQTRSRIIAVPGDESGISARGFTAGLVIFDEAAYVDDRTIASVRPMTAVVPDARIVSISSAGFGTGWFWRSFQQRDPDIRYASVTADDCPRIGQLFLAKERRRLGERRFQAEFFNEWLQEGGAFFSAGFFAALAGQGGAYTSVERDPEPEPEPEVDPAILTAARARARALNSVVKAMDNRS